MLPINIWAVLGAAIIANVIGFLWYGPVFGKYWIGLLGLDNSREGMATLKAKAKAEGGMAKSYALMFVGSLVMSYVLSAVVFFTYLFFLGWGVLAGPAVGFLAWLGFVAPVTLSSVLWEGKSWRLWVLNNGYYLVTFMVMGLTFMVWA